MIHGELARAFEAVAEHWSPRVIADANGQYVKIAKVRGEFVWHAHEDEDEFFLVLKGTFVLRFRDGSQVVLNEGDFHVVPRGVEHQPVAEEECWILFVEPAQTKHTGEVITDRTRSIEEQVAHRRLG
jgi:mannose-6-phosphate isomerase-like protein (cupin superfamily)